jgi:hypothetical protein
MLNSFLTKTHTLTPTLSLSKIPLVFERGRERESMDGYQLDLIIPPH